MGEVYSDLNQYSPTKKAKLTDVAAISQSLNNILSTQRYERLFNIEFGVDLEERLFDLIDDVSAFEILGVIAQRVQLFEQRVDLDFTRSVVQPYPDQNKYEVSLIYSLKGQPELGEQEFRGVVRK